jgi:ABC-2 type transport system permease protein
MSPTINAMRLGVVRGWIEFKMLFLKNPQNLLSTVIFAILLVGVLWFQREAKFGGVSLAILTLPGLLGMLIANEGLSSIAKLLSYDREDGTLLRAKAIPQGMVGYLIARVVLTLFSTIFNLALLFVLSLFVVPGLTNLDGVRILIFLGIVVLGLLATAPMGAIIGSLVKSSGAGFGLTFFPLVALVAISGIFYPISVLPAWAQWIAQAFPVYWLGLGLRSVFLPQATAALELGGTFRPLATFLMLAAWSVVGLLLAPPTLRRMARRTSGSEMVAGKQRSMRGVG